MMKSERYAQPMQIGSGWRPLLIDWVGFFRPQLRGCVSKHYASEAGKALPAIELGMVASVQQVSEAGSSQAFFSQHATRQIPQLLALNRTGDTSSLVRLAGKHQERRDVIVADRQVKVSHIEEAGVHHFVIRGAQNVSARKSEPVTPEPGKRGRPATRGSLVRPTDRHYRGKLLSATPSDREEAFIHQGRALQAKWFEKIIVSGSTRVVHSSFIVSGSTRVVHSSFIVSGSTRVVHSSFIVSGSTRVVHCLVVADPRYKQPWVLLTDLEETSAETIYLLYRARWTIEQLPQTGKQLLGGHRAFVHAKESRFRLPEVSLLCATISLYLSATGEAVASGFWDRHPKRTPGRLRRVLAGANLPQFRELAAGSGRVRQKRAVHDHLPKGILAHCRQARQIPTPILTGN